MLGKMREKTGRVLTALSLCLTLALVLEMAPVRAATFDQKIAANGTGFVKLSDAEKTDFLLFGSHATKADGMQGRWKMLTKAQVQSVKDNESAVAAFGDYGYSIWTTGQNFSTTANGSTFQYDRNVQGINLWMLANGMGIVSNVNTKTQLTAIDRSGAKVRTTSHAFEKPHYYFDTPSSTGIQVRPVLKADGKFSLRVGQSTAQETTAHQWKNDIKALQIDTVTTATQKPDVVFDAVADGKTQEYVLSDIVDAGQYRASFSYYDGANKQTTTQVEGARLSDVLSAKSIMLTAGDTITAENKQGKKTVLKNEPGKYILAYKGTIQKAGEASSALQSDSEFCLLGPGKTEAEVLINNIYSVEITRKAPARTKIVKLTKKKKTITVKWKKVSIANGYEVWMATKKKGKYKKIKTINKPNTVKFTKKKLKRGKKYYFKVRSFKKINGSKLYSPWSAVKYKKL